MSATTTTRNAQLADAVTKAQAFATAYLLLETGLRSDIAASSGAGTLPATAAGLYLGDLRSEMCGYLSGLGLTAVVADAAIANAAATVDSRTSTFPARWTAKITANVP